MSRQIHPGIFGDTLDPMGGMSTAHLPSLETLPLMDAVNEGPNNEEISELIQKQQYENEKWIKTLNLRIDKIVSKMQFMEERLKSTITEVNERMAYVMSRTKERQNSESKIEAVIERHNQIVQTFDLRITQAQRVIENQSHQIARQQELIDEARRQIEKLKRL